MEEKAYTKTGDIRARVRTAIDQYGVRPVGSFANGMLWEPYVFFEQANFPVGSFATRDLPPRGLS